MRPFRQERGFVDELRTTRVRQRFSRAAASYEANAEAQRLVAAQLIQRMADLTVEGRILDVGCGTGSLTRMLVEAFPQAEIDALDVSPAMIEEAKRRLPSAGSVRWLVGDATCFEAQAPYDLVVSSSSLQWLQPFGPAIHRLARCLKPQGTMAFAMMVDGTWAELRKACLEIAPHKAPRGLPKIEDVRKALGEAGLSVVHFTSEKQVVHYPTVRALISAIRGQGVTAKTTDPEVQPLTRRELDRLFSLYASEYLNPGQGLPLTYRACTVISINNGENTELHSLS